MTLSLLLRFKRLGVKLCRERDIDKHTIDFESIYDSGISYYENKRMLTARINSLARQFQYCNIREIIEKYRQWISNLRNNPNSLYRFFIELKK